MKSSRGSKSGKKKKAGSAAKGGDFNWGTIKRVSVRAVGLKVYSTVFLL